MNKLLMILVVLIFAGAAVLLISFGSDPSTGQSSPTPIPTITPTPEQTPVPPGDILQVDVTQQSGTLTVNGHGQKQPVTCTKYDNVYVNGTGTVATVNGACRQIMINGDRDQITADAVTEFVFNGSGNDVTYSRFVNGKTPSIVQNQSGNNVERVPLRTNGKGKE